MKWSTWGVASLLGALLISTLPAWCWGKDGHRTIGMVADIILDQAPATRDRVRQILGENSLSEVSVWADCAKAFRYCHRSPTAEEAAFAEENPRHHLFHYTDVPIQQSQYRAGTAGKCKSSPMPLTSCVVGRRTTVPPSSMSATHYGC